MYLFQNPLSTIGIGSVHAEQRIASDRPFPAVAADGTTFPRDKSRNCCCSVLSALENMCQTLFRPIAPLAPADVLMTFATPRDSATTRTTPPRSLGQPTTATPENSQKSGVTIAIEPKDYSHDRRQADEALSRFLAHPGFGITRIMGDHRCTMMLNHSEKDTQSKLHKDNVVPLGDYHFKYDRGLNVNFASRFDAFSALRTNLAQSMLARAGCGPACSMALIPEQKLIETWGDGKNREFFQPVVMCASKNVPGEEIDTADKSEVNALMRSRKMAPALAMAYILDMNDVFKPQRAIIHNLIREAGTGKIQIIDGFDDSDCTITLKHLREKSISGLFGVDRAEFEKMLENSLQETLMLAAENAPALDKASSAQAPDDPNDRHYLRAVEAYAEGCRKRVAQLQD